MKLGIQWIILPTKNYTASRAFYTEKLGFTIDREVATDEFCQFNLGTCYLAIFNHANLSKLLGAAHGGNAGGAVYSFPESTDIDADYTELVNKGVQFFMPPTTQAWGQRTAYFTDPDGHIWELQQWVKSE